MVTVSKIVETTDWCLSMWRFNLFGIVAGISVVPLRCHCFSWSLYLIISGWRRFLSSLVMTFFFLVTFMEIVTGADHHCWYGRSLLRHISERRHVLKHFAPFVTACSWSVVGRRLDVIVDHLSKILISLAHLCIEWLRCLYPLAWILILVRFLR